MNLPNIITARTTNQTVHLLPADYMKNVFLDDNVLAVTHVWIDEKGNVMDHEIYYTWDFDEKISRLERDKKISQLEQRMERL